MVSPRPKVGLVLTGGGARAAYQAGVLRAIAEMLPDPARNPFPVICGTSAGAINAASLAVSAVHFSEGVRELEKVWSNFHVNQVYRSDLMGVLGNSTRCMFSMLSNNSGKQQAVSLLDNSPLGVLLKHRIPFRGIQRSISAGALHALGITAWGYTSGQSVTFYQGKKDILPWKRAQRIGIPARIGEPDRTWMAMAAYNIGMGHLEDARILTERQGGNPDLWVDVKRRLPQLRQKKYYRTTKYGYARGDEALTYVENIRRYYDSLVWLDEQGKI